jgi:hypothetical protein
MILTVIIVLVNVVYSTREQQKMIFAANSKAMALSNESELYVTKKDGVGVMHLLCTNENVI